MAWFRDAVTMRRISAFARSRTGYRLVVTAAWLAVMMLCARAYSSVYHQDPDKHPEGWFDFPMGGNPLVSPEGRFFLTPLFGTVACLALLVARPLPRSLWAVAVPAGAVLTAATWFISHHHWCCRSVDTIVRGYPYPFSVRNYRTGDWDRTHLEWIGLLTDVVVNALAFLLAALVIRAATDLHRSIPR
ncbi:hypothetical protein [Nocardia acididurans]|nr:hypothetical protein [Nocardia acididurans]